MKRNGLIKGLVVSLLLSFPMTAFADDLQGAEAVNEIEVISVEAFEDVDGSIEYEYKVKNNTESSISNLSFVVSELDDDNVIRNTSYPSSSSRVDPGQSIIIRGRLKSEERPISLRLDEYSWYDDSFLSFQKEKFEDGDFIVCSIDDILNGKNDEIVPEPLETNIEVYNNEGIAVYLIGMEGSEYGYPRVHLQVNNLNHHNIYVETSYHSAVINGKMVTTSPWIAVKSGKTATEYWDIYDGDLADAGIDKIENMSFAVSITDADTYDNLYKGDDIFINVGDNYALTERTVYTDKEHIRQVQEMLKQLGYECGPVDGISGKKTYSSILEFERDHELAETTDITQELFDALKEAAA